LYGIAIFDEEQGLIYKITGLSLSSFEKMGLIAIILKIKGLVARALGFMIHFSIENPWGSSPMDRETTRSTVVHCQAGAARSPERKLVTPHFFKKYHWFQNLI
jgi:hypothetical protein